MNYIMPQYLKKNSRSLKKQPDKIQKILAVVKLLEKGGVSQIPKKMKPHMLIGQYQGCLECHIEGDFTPYMATR